MTKTVLTVYDNGTDQLVTQLPRGEYKVVYPDLSVKHYSVSTTKEEFIFPKEGLTIIYPVTINRIVIHYTTDGEDQMSVEDYNDNCNVLLRKRDEYGNWESLDDEYNYRKFINIWQPIETTYKVTGDPLELEIQEALLDTGNKYITNTILNASDFNQNNIYYTYNRGKMFFDTVDEVLQGLGMERSPDKLDYLQTKNKMIYSWGTRGRDQYLLAFGGYPISKFYEYNFKNQLIYRNSLGVLKEKYLKDKQLITDHLQEQFKIHFGVIVNGKGIRLEEEIKNIENALNYLYDINTRSQASKTAVESVRHNLNRAKKGIIEKLELNE